jgi:alpha-N-acetylglucosaminidase
MKASKLFRGLILSLILILPLSVNAENKAARALYERILGERSSYFILNEKKSNDGSDYFELVSLEGGKISVVANSANSMAVALNHYLRYYCKTSVSWYVCEKVQLPDNLPAVNEKVVVNSVCKNRFFLNYCTFGYTMPWWQWPDWERFIDWMALNGVNMPLAITGQESVWYKVWKKLGLNDSQIRSYFTGPAHLPWHRMLNIDYWQGPLPVSWLQNQEELQKMIVARERELNMTPVLPAFSGHVPYELKQIYPQAKISKLSQWGGFDSTYRSSFLDPMDPLFKTIQKDFLDEQTRLYGSDHIYGIDPFNEIVPPSWEPEYLGRVSGTIFETLKAVDPKAVWLQMSWLYYYQRKDWTNPRIEAFVKAVPQDKMILLDYFCERTEVWKMTDKFFGQPYIWCYLGNFGGNTMLAGDLDEVGKRIDNTIANGGSNFWGLGSTLEGFDCNPLMYEFVFDKAWNFKIDNKSWIEAWASRRAGISDSSVTNAWNLINDNAYKITSKTGHCNWTNARPTLGKAERYAKTGFAYDNRELLKAWGLMLNSLQKNRDSYAFDVVNIGRQVLCNHFDNLWKKYLSAVKEGNLESVAEIENSMTELLADIDKLLASNSTFLLGKWIADARKMGVNEKEADYYEINARNILTSWGEEGGQLSDYANRTWAGLVSSFYAERWRLFFEESRNALAEKREFNEASYKSKIVAFEGRWWRERVGTFKCEPDGNSIETAKILFAKYKDSINRIPYVAQK